MSLKIKVIVLFVVLIHVACLPASNEKKEVITTKSTRYCHSQTPCAWKIYNYSDFAEISLNNDYCVCRPGQKCKFHEKRITEGYSEYRCMWV